MALLLVLAAAPGAAQDADVRVLVEVLDAKGRVPAGLTAADLEVREGDASRQLSGLERWSPHSAPARAVIYFDRALSSSGTVKRAASALADQARPLTVLGEVEVVAAGVAPESELRSRDELVVGETLSRAALTDVGERRILELRRRVLRDLRLTAPPESALAADEIAEVVTAGVEEELELVRERLAQLLVWAAAHGTASHGAASGGAASSGAASTSERAPRLLLLVMDGFDLDPVGFYLPFLDENGARAAIRGAARLATLEAAAREAGRTLAALGWTVQPLVLAPSGDETEGIEYAPIAVGGELQETTSAPGVTLRPGALFGRRGEREDAAPKAPVAAFVDARAPLAILAEATGGEVIASEQGLRDNLARFAGRFELRYASALALDSDPERLEVRARRPGWTVRAPRWLGRGVPQHIADLRLRRLLAGIEDEGALDVAAVLEVDEPEAAEAPDAEAPDAEALDAEAPDAEDAPTAPAARLEARLSLRELAAAAPDGESTPLAAAVFRVTLGVAVSGEEPRLRHEVVRAENLAELEEWRYRTRLDLPGGATEVAVLVEDLAGGEWGGRRATVVAGGRGGADLLPAPTVVEVLPPEREVLRGRVKFETQVYDSRVTQVDFLLDDREVATRRQAPFAARIDLGRTPRRRELTVVAYDAADVELGRDTVVINGGSGGLTVEIVRPADGRGTGWVEVEAEVAVPLEHRLDRVLFFWNNQQVATVYGSPFKQRVFIPEDKPLGYVRVVALLDDGTLAEDVAFMNGPDHGERLEVNLVELYVVVTDAAGRPVRGLARDEFRVREDGVPQDIATFSDASDLPLTLGMAIDSSASMFVKLPAVQSAAIGFLRSTFSAQDRAFVVDFDSEPRLARSTTGSLDRIVSSIDTLEANGRTALWESIVFSLVQLQGVRGRKSLIVFSDGADEDDRFPFRSSLSVAKKMGVPIYLILMKKKPKEGSGFSLLTRSFTSRADRLVEATGGRVFYAKEYGDLGAVYKEIEYELRSQYLLAYYPKEPSRGESWRTVVVDVEGKGLESRTLKGYWD